MSRTDDLLNERERKRSQRLFGADGWEDAPPPLEPKLEAPALPVETGTYRLACAVCGADGRAQLVNQGDEVKSVHLMPGCQCGEIHTDPLAYHAEASERMRTIWTNGRLALRIRRGQTHAYNRGAARGRRSY